MPCADIAIAIEITFWAIDIDNNDNHFTTLRALLNRVSVQLICTSDLTPRHSDQVLIVGAMCRYCNCKARNRNWPQLTTISITPDHQPNLKNWIVIKTCFVWLGFLILSVEVIYASFLSDLGRKLIQSEMYIFPRIKCNSRGTKPNLKLKPTIHSGSNIGSACPKVRLMWTQSDKCRYPRGQN